jgi:hypothetical protein
VGDFVIWLAFHVFQKCSFSREISDDMGNVLPSLTNTHVHAEALHLVFPNLVGRRLSSFKSYRTSGPKSIVMLILKFP